ncbi:MAG TPA: TolC family protein [Bacteroidales bacterium]|nr:TolC family protein [Bacteroidales bacterium]
MKGKIIISTLLIITCVPILQAQKILTLRECYERAFATNSLAGEKEAYSSIWKLKDDNLSKGWLPTLDANGSFIYNSSVVDMSGVLGSIPIAGFADAIKPLPHEQYKITVDINQTIYDGGAIKGARALEKAELGVNEKQTEADLYKLRGQINSYYFSILLLDRQKELLNTYLEIINKRISSMQSAFSNGTMIQSDINVMLSEKIKLEQQISEIRIRKTSLLNILSDITGTEIDPSTDLVVPVQQVETTSEIVRPEIQVFDLRKEQLSAGLKVIQSKRMPKAFGFATLGYGNPPGSNFFKDEFAPYYMLGAGIKWNIFDWNKAKNEKQLISFQQSIVENRKADLIDNLNRLLESKKAEIANLKSLIETDSELIALKKRITTAAESQYENGTITATEYLNEMNSERQAVINYEIHKINFAMAGTEYLNISGKEIE